MNFGGERLFSLFFLLILVRICTVKPLFCKNFPAARAKFLGSAYFRIFSRSAYYFHFSAFRKFWRALIILRKSSEMTLERLLRGGYYLQYPGIIFLRKKNKSIYFGVKHIQRRAPNSSWAARTNHHNIARQKKFFFSSKVPAGGYELSAATLKS